MQLLMAQPSTNNQDAFSTREKIQYTLLGVLVLGGSFLLGRRLVRDIRSNSEQKKTFDDTSAPGFAQQLKMAFENDNYFGWGTDEQAIRKIIRAVPTKDEFKRIINSYQKLYARSLMADLKEELTSTEYNEMLAIIAAKPEKSGGAPDVAARHLSWAKRLKAAFDTTYWSLPGTDEEAIKAVFMEIPSQQDFTEMARVYQKTYGNELTRDLKSELELWEYGPMMAIITKKPKA
jgi:hypothetical protein